MKTFTRILLVVVVFAVSPFAGAEKPRHKNKRPHVSAGQNLKNQSPEARAKRRAERKAKREKRKKDRMAKGSRKEGGTPHQAIRQSEAPTAPPAAEQPAVEQPAVEQPAGQ